MKKKFLFLAIALLTALVSWAQDSPTYNLTVSVNKEQGATPNGSGQYEAGKKVYVYVNLTSDYKLVKWTEDGKDIEADVTKTGFQYVMPNHDVELKAYVAYDPKTPENPNVDERVFHTLTVITLPANTGVSTDTYRLEVGKKQTLSQATPADYRFLGWFLNGKQVGEPGNYELIMPDNALTLERRYVYDPTVPTNPGANTCYTSTDGLLELIIDDFHPSMLNVAISKLKKEEGFDYNMVTSLIVKGKVLSKDFYLYNLQSLKKIDFSRTDLQRIESYSWSRSELTTVLLPPSLEEIENSAFKECPSLNRITCLATTPPTLGKNVFEGIPEGAFLYVPSASIDLYKEAEQWKDFIIYPVADELTSLTVQLPVDCADGRCKNMRLEVVNAKSGVRQKYIVSDRMTYVFDLIHDCPYHVYLVTQKGEVLSQMENIDLGTSPINITLPDLKPLYDVTLRVVQENGIDVTPQVEVHWLDANGNALGSGTTLTQLTEGCRLTAVITLPEALARTCQLPARVEHTVTATADDNEITVTLLPLAKKTLSALVVNDEGGAYLNGAWVQATQTLYGRYNHNSSGATDNYGMSDLTLYSDVPATITVSHNGYYTETVNIDNIAELEYLPTVRLRPFKGITVGLIANGYSDYQDIAVSVANETKGTAIPDARLQYPYLVLPESVDSTDVLAITAHSMMDRFVDVTQTMTVSDLKVVFTITANGSVEATYENSKNESVRAMLYDADGQLVDTKRCENRKASFGYLPTGDYTVVMMSNSQQFAGIGNLDDFDRLGLHDQVEYVKQAVSVSLGETAVAEFTSVPLFVEGRFSYIGSKGSFICTTANPRKDFAATFRASIDFKDEYREGISNVRLIVDYDNNAEFVDGSVVLNTLLHDYAKGEQTAEVDSLHNGDEVKFCLMPKNDGIMTAAAYVEFDYNGQRLRQPLGSARVEAHSVELFVPEETPTPDVTINLKNIPYGKYQSAEFYDNGVLIGTIPDLTSVYEMEDYGIEYYHSAGTNYANRWSNNNKASLHCKLHDAYYYSYHNLQAKLIANDGSCLLTQTKSVMYNPVAIVPSDLGIYQTSTSSTSGYVGGGGSIYGLSGGLMINYHPAVNMGLLSRSLSSRSYSVSPKKQLAHLEYFVHFLHNDKLFDMLKDKEIILTKHYGTNSDNYETQDFHLGIDNWMDLPSTQGVAPGHHYVTSSQLYFMDDRAIDSRYLQYGEQFTPDMKIFHYEETVGLDKLPKNFSLSYDYADDFEFPEDTESNNRFVKQMKAAMAEVEKITTHLNSLWKQFEEELGKNEPDIDYVLQLLDEIKECYVQLANGKRHEITEEEEQLIKDLVDAKTEAERDEIWKQLIPDITQTPEYQKMEQWMKELNTSVLYFEPIEIREGVWTPAIKYEIGTPATGNFLFDMSDGNWHAEQLFTEDNQDVMVFVNDKGGDRITIDYSAHSGGSANSAKDRKSLRRKVDSFEEKSAALDAFTMDFLNNIINVGIGLPQFAIMWENGVVLGERTLQEAINEGKPFEKIITIAEEYFKNKNIYDAERIALGNKLQVGTGIAATAVNIGFTAYNSYNAYDAYYKDKAAWDDLIERIKAGCKDSERVRDVINEAEWQRAEARVVRGGNIVGIASAGIVSTYIAFAGKGKAAWLSTAAIMGLDAIAAKIQQEWSKENLEDMQDIIASINALPECSSIHTQIPVTDDVIPLIDPSGYVYEAVPSNRLEGVSATCYYKDSLQNNYGDWVVIEQRWNAQEFDQLNPQLTNELGKYGWDVPMGMWQVRYEKDGYEPTRSEWLPVPPPQLEVNIPMVQRTAPEVEMAHVYQDGIELLFSKYMQPETLTPDMLKVKVIRNGKETLLSDIKVELLNEEAAAKGSETTYASRLRLTSETGWQNADEILLIVNHRVKSYCGVTMQEDYTQHFDIEKRIEKIEAEEKLEMAVGESQELKVSVVPAEAGAGKTLRLFTTSNELVEMSDKEVVLDAEGKATVTLTGKTIGSTSVALNIDGEMAEEMVIVEVLDPDNLFVDMPLSTPGSGSVLREGETVTLSTTTKDAQIYYTTDGSCPCDEQGTRQLYKGPINIYGETVIKAQAVREGWYDSNVATFVFTLDSPDGVKNVNRNVHPSIYDLQGRKVDIGQAHRGIYIVVGEGDSKPRKTFIK